MGKKTRKRKFKMTTGEMVIITVLFHLSGIRTFKHFYIYCVQRWHKEEFPNTVSYNRFVELIQFNLLLTLYKDFLLGKMYRNIFLDSTPIGACKNK